MKPNAVTIEIDIRAAWMAAEELLQCHDLDALAKDALRKAIQYTGYMEDYRLGNIFRLFQALNSIYEGEADIISDLRSDDMRWEISSRFSPFTLIVEFSYPVRCYLTKNQEWWADEDSLEGLDEIPTLESCSQTLFEAYKEMMGSDYMPRID